MRCFWDSLLHFAVFYSSVFQFTYYNPFTEPPFTFKILLFFGSFISSPLLRFPSLLCRQKLHELRGVFDGSIGKL